MWDAWSFFKLLDLDQGGAVSVDEFLMGCLRFRGAARAMDVCRPQWCASGDSLKSTHADGLKPVECLGWTRAGNPGRQAAPRPELAYQGAEPFPRACGGGLMTHLG